MKVELQESLDGFCLEVSDESHRQALLRHGFVAEQSRYLDSLAGSSEGFVSLVLFSGRNRVARDVLKLRYAGIGASLEECLNGEDICLYTNVFRYTENFVLFHSPENEVAGTANLFVSNMPSSVKVYSHLKDLRGRNKEIVLMDTLMYAQQSYSVAGLYSSSISKGFLGLMRPAFQSLKSANAQARGATSLILKGEQAREFTKKYLLRK